MIRYAFAALVLLAVVACASSPWKQEQADNHLNIGIAYLGSERYNEALREFLQAESFSPRDPRVYYHMGIAYYEMGVTDKALEAFNKAVSLKEDYSEAHNFLGSVYLGKEQWDRAIASFTKALTNIMYETPDKALFNLGRAYYGKGDYATAMKWFAEAKNKKPNTVPLPILDHHLGMTSYAKGNFQEASRHFMRALEQAPAFLEARFWLGHSYVKMQNHGKAREEFNAVIKAAPESELAAEARKSLNSIQ